MRDVKKDEKPITWFNSWPSRVWMFNKSTGKHVSFPVTKQDKERRDKFALYMVTRK